MTVSSAKYLEGGSILAVIDGVTRNVPDNMGNRRRKMIAAWEAESEDNKITAYSAPAPTQADYEDAIQSMLDDAAKAKFYSDGVSLSTYANSTNTQWAAEANAFIAWRDAVWAYAYTQLALVGAGERAQPSVAELLSELPAVSWPT